jgi:autotransporter-associated beta strand protein
LLGTPQHTNGTTTVSGGTLQFGNGSAGVLPNNGGSSPVFIASGAAVGVDEGSSTPMYNNITNSGTLYGDQGAGHTNNLAATISGGGVVIENGSGTLILAGNNNYTGTTTVDSGTLQAGNANAFGTLSDLTLANAAGAALNISGWNITLGSLAGGGTLGGNIVSGSNNLTVGGDGATTTYGGAISGAGAFYKTGSGSLTLTGSSSFNGGGNVSGGILNLQNSDALGTGTTQTFAVYQNTTLQLQGGITLPAYTIQVAGAGTLGQDGAIVNVGGTNTISGPINVTGAGSGLTTISSDSGTLIIAGGMTTGYNNVIVTGAGTGIFANTVAINSDGNYIEKDGSGLWDFENASNTFAGNLHLNSGTVSFVSGGLGQTTINANGGVLKYDTGNTQDASGGAGNPTIQYSNGPIEIDTNGNSVTFANTLGNDNQHGLTKYGSGTLTLAAAGTAYSGITNVSGGTLDITGSLANSSSLLVNAGTTPATLILDGANAVLSYATITGTAGSSVPTVTINANQNFASLANAGTSNFNVGSTTIGTIPTAE